MTIEDEYCETFFKNSYSRNKDGRFLVTLPIKEEMSKSLGKSREIAQKRLYALERKFINKPELKTEYVKFMREYLALGHMKRAKENLDNELRVFLPHHAVVKKSSTTTKTRVVFDASSKDSKGISLNDTLYKGPTIQSDLFSIIVRFRCFRYVLCADITKMYRQILVAEDQTRLQTILWRENPSDSIENFELITITYGTKPASFLAIRCLQQLAEIEKVNFPVAAEVVVRDFYMDDLLTGANTVHELKQLKEDITNLLLKGGFELHKWNTNIPNLFDNIQTTNKSVDIDKEPESKLLGILWNPYKDTFHYKTNTIWSDGHVTKRAMLFQVCKLFDPLGLVGPVVTLAKILVQNLWARRVQWDESVPMDIYKAWHQIRTQLKVLNTLEIPRLIMLESSNLQVQVHGFCHASEKAYGACIYLRGKDHQGNTIVALIYSKSRVAPLKTLSLPRLELCGAILLINLMNRVLTSLNVTVHQKYYWTDSKIVLAWIDAPARKWHVFVANRVNEIHSSSSPSEWQHVASKENPADLISRGLLPSI